MLFFLIELTLLNKSTIFVQLRSILVYSFTSVKIK